MNENINVSDGKKPNDISKIINEEKVMVQGMTCASCEMLVERSWKKIPGVIQVKANSSDGSVLIESDREIKQDELQKNLLDQKYRVQIGQQSQIASIVSKRPASFELVGLFALAIALTWVLTRLGGFATGVGTGATIGIGAAFFLGLLASGSSCLAVVSGLLLSCAIPSDQDSGKNLTVRLLPTVLFLIGRVIVYALLGGILGWLGARMAFSPMVTASILGAAALYMIFTGLDMLHLMPTWVRNNMPRVPKSWVHGIMNKTGGKGSFMPFLLGGATFFLPCGFTQALQAYALTTGSFITSALVLGSFALGTAPGLFALGALAGSMRGHIGKFVLKTAGALVIVLGIFNLRNGIALAGITFPPESWNLTDKQTGVVVPVPKNNSIQVIKMKADRGGYYPNKFTIQKGVPIRWEIDATQAAGCGRALVSRKLGINKVLDVGKNVFEFTPTELGTIPFSCSMGMYTGQFNVVEFAGKQVSVVGDIENEPLVEENTNPGSCHGGSEGCSSCAGF